VAQTPIEIYFTGVVPGFELRFLITKFFMMHPFGATES
jgi:hypothetical protein